MAAIVNIAREGPAAPQPERPSATAPEPTVETDALGGDESLAGELPRLLPLPGELREEGGILWWSSTRCKAGALELSSGSVTRIPGEHCRIWPSPDGRAALTVTARRSAALDGRGLEYVTLAGEQAVVFHSRGFIGSEVAWSADGQRVAVCVGTRSGTVVDLYRSVPGDREELPGACVPAWLPDGGLATSSARPPSVGVDGQNVLSPQKARALLPSVARDGRRAVSALAAGGGRLLAGLVAVSDTRLLPTAGALAVLRPDGQVDFEARLAAGILPAAVGLSPDASALWYHEAGDARAVIVSIPGGTRVPIFGARWISWSPDGRFLAAAQEGAIALYSWGPVLKQVASVPVDASDVSWTRRP